MRDGAERIDLALTYQGARRERLARLGYNAAMHRMHSPDTAGSSYRLQRTPAPPLSRATLRGYSLMRWLTLGASTGAPLLGLKHPLQLGGIAALVAGVVGYVLLVNYHFGQSRCDQALPPRLPPGVYTALSVALVFALMVLPAEATNGQSLWFCVMFFVVIGETRHLRSIRAVIATVAASGVAIGLAVAVAVPANDRLTTWLEMLPLLAGLAATAYGNHRQQQQEREHAARLAVLIELRAATSELENANRRLTEQAAAVEALAIANERNRMARELHDVLGYTLATVVVKAEAARRLLPSDPARVAEELGRIQEVARSGLSEVRRSVGALRQEDAPDPEAEAQPSDYPGPLAAWHAGRISAAATGERDQEWDRGIRALVERTAFEAGLQSVVDLGQLPNGAGDELVPVLFRVIQESLTNVIRHAAASKVEVTGRMEESRFVLEIVDDGRGIGPGDHPCGYGIRGMRERVAELGGTLQLIGAEGAGMTVRVSVPIGAAVHADLRGQVEGPDGAVDRDGPCPAQARQASTHDAPMLPDRPKVPALPAQAKEGTACEPHVKRARHRGPVPPAQGHATGARR